MNTLIKCYLPVFLCGFSFSAFWETECQDYALFREKSLDLLAQAARDVEAAGYGPRVCDAAFFAVVAWLDERVLCSSLPVAGEWRKHLLQTHFFQTTTGGELFFEKLKSLESDEGTSDNLTLCVLYYFCLLLGFQGGAGQDTDWHQRMKTCRSDIKRYFSPGQIAFACVPPAASPPDSVVKKIISQGRNGMMVVAGGLLFSGVFYFCYSGLY
ncbi:DotU family type IV/VI secretion system protein [Salmonella enterica]|nr:DotU family type IV/VI secretion system protein [Salmonella enterica subsp. enterica serovar Sandiego]EIQ4400392.1 DotU family type IV/VI secretion system protein [Salmonella enterica]